MYKLVNRTINTSLERQWRVEIPLKYVYSPVWFSILDTRISVLTSPNINRILFINTHTLVHIHV